MIDSAAICIVGLTNGVVLGSREAEESRSNVDFWWGGWDFDQGNRDSLITGGCGERGVIAQGIGVM